MATEKKPVAKEQTLADMQAEIKTMLAEAQAARDEAKKLLDEAKETAGKKSGQTPEEKAAAQARANELVEVKLFKDANKYKDDMFVSVNGENVVIKRGERVKIKRKYAEVLDNSDRQDYETAMLIEAKTSEFAKSGL